MENKAIKQVHNGINCKRKIKSVEGNTFEVEPLIKMSRVEHVAIQKALEYRNGIKFEFSKMECKQWKCKQKKKLKKETKIGGCQECKALDGKRLIFT